MLGPELVANEWVFRIKPLKVKLLAGEQKATKSLKVKCWFGGGPPVVVVNPPVRVPVEKLSNSRTRHSGSMLVDGRATIFWGGTKKTTGWLRLKFGTPKIDLEFPFGFPEEKRNKTKEWLEK